MRPSKYVQFKMNMRYYIESLINEESDSIHQYYEVYVQTYDSLQRQQYEREINLKEKHVHLLRLLYNMTKEEG